MKFRYLSAVIGAPVVLLGWSALCAAEDIPGDSGGLEEITVTAQRRSERLNDVPMSIAVFSQEQMDQQGLKNVDDLTRMTPGVTFLRNGMAGSFNDEQSNISIRGVYSNAGAATTGIYIDDTPIQTRHLSYGTADPYPVLFDLDHVEVLRGPQGTLFGGGSEGGTIRFIRPEPSLTTYSGYVRSEVADIDNGGLNYEGGAAFGGPIIPDVLGFRVSIYYREDGGWIDRVNYITEPTAGNPIPVATNTTEKNSNWHDTYVGSAALKWQPTDNLTVEPSLYAQTLHINDTSMYWQALSNAAAEQFKSGNIQRDPNTDPFYLLSLKVTWHLPFADAVSNTSYLHRREHADTDYTQWLNTNYLGNVFPTAAQAATTYAEDDQQNITEELRLSSNDPSGRVNWSGGLFLSRDYEDQPEITTDASYAGLVGAAPVPGNIVDNQPIFNTIDKQAALFGELGVKITEQWKATAGVRAAHLTYSGTNVESGLLVGPAINSHNSASENPVTPRFVLDYQQSQDSLYYASAAKGYRPGGINTSLPTICTENLPISVSPTFQSDSLWQYEVGTKQTLLEKRLQVNGSLYYLKWKNIQQLTFLPCGLGFTPNLGEVTGRGGDIKADFRATDALTLGIDLAYTDSYYTNSETIQAGTVPVTIVSAGDHLPGSPWNVDVNAEYVLQEFEHKPYVRLDYQYATAQNSLTSMIDPKNTGSDPNLRGLPEIRVLAMRAGVRFEGFDISVFVQNALNFHAATYYYRDSQQAVDTNYFYRGLPPRTVGVTAAYRF